jgi:hypothetical protein
MGWFAKSRKVSEYPNDLSLLLFVGSFSSRQRETKKGIRYRFIYKLNSQEMTKNWFLAFFLCAFSQMVLAQKNQDINKPTVQSGKKAETRTKVDAKPSQSAIVTPRLSNAPKPLPNLPESWIRLLLDSCTLVDYTYMTMPISMSIDQANNIRASLRHIGVGAVEQKAGCKVFAKVFYQIKGRIALYADLYFANGCTYFIWFIHDKPQYANLVSTEGVEFFNQIIARQAAKKN